MTKIVETTGGKFDVIASGLSWVDAMNQTMALEVNVGGTFRECPDDMTAEQFAEWKRSASNNSCPVQADWAYL